MMTSYLSIFKKNINCQKNASCASKYVFTGRNRAIFTLGEFLFQKNNLRTTALVSQYANVKGGVKHRTFTALQCIVFGDQNIEYIVFQQEDIILVTL